MKTVEDIVHSIPRCPALSEDNKLCFMSGNVCAYRQQMKEHKMPNCEDYSVYLINALTARNSSEEIR